MHDGSAMGERPNMVRGNAPDNIYKCSSLFLTLQMVHGTICKVRDIPMAKCLHIFNMLINHLQSL